MSKSTHKKSVVPAGHRGWFSLPELGAELCLNPAEATLFRLFLAHPEGLLADDLVLHWQELSDIYARESRSDDPDLRENALVSLCSESKRVFYANNLEIKRIILLTNSGRPPNFCKVCKMDKKKMGRWLSISPLIIHRGKLVV